MKRRLLAAGVALIGALLLVPTSQASSEANKHNASPTLVSQSPWVVSGQTFNMTVALPAGTPQTDEIQLFVYSRLTTRTGFNQVLSGQVSGDAAWRFYPTHINRLPRDSAGNVVFRIPVDTSASGTLFPTFYASSSQGPGVFPVQVSLFDPDGNPVGKPLTTFLVYGGSPGASSVQKLSMALTVPVQAAPTLTPALVPARIGSGASRALAARAAVLGAHTDVPVTLAVTPQTLDALAAGSPADRSALALLAAASPDDEVLPATYVNTDVAALLASGLDSEVTVQIAAGLGALSRQLHRTPPMRTWVVDGPLDETTAADLARRGVSQFIVPDGDLSTLPDQARQTTYGRPSPLSLKVPGHLSVVGADADLSRLLTSHASPVLVANEFLAELAMVQVERPSAVRGVAVLPPSGWSPSEQLLDTIMSGLAGNPLVQAVTADQLFKSVPQGSSDQPAISRSLDARASAGWAQEADLRAARQQLSAFATVVPAKAIVTNQALTRMLFAASVDLPARTRHALLEKVGATTQEVLRQIRLPGSSSITLTSRNASVPLTLLSDPSVQAHVQLRLSSTKLAFRPFTPPGSTPCSVVVPTEETCDLVLTTAVTTLRVPVETRTSGVFPLSVAMWSPDGALQLDSNSNTVRSTAVSWVGIVLIVAAALLLAVWWIRDIRHGRRRPQLVERGSPLPPSRRVAAPSSASESEPTPRPPAAAPSRVGAPSSAPPVAEPPPAPEPPPPPPPLPPPASSLPGDASQSNDDETVEQFFGAPPPQHGR
ncbi:MAG: hypothetical protein J2P57_06040 [Acidimicrobiaceae bacterium]|nr:hypothetical protein [Acidimicrobiaceae bacterium]